MHFSTLLLLPVAVLAIPTTAPSGSCAAVAIITARGSTEAAGEGSIGALASSIQSNSKQTVSRTSVTYPASISNYGPSVSSGVAALTANIKSAIQACPNQKLVLLGYSQGAQVVGDTLGGGGGAGSATTPPIDFASLGSKVAASVFYGDPRYSTSQTAIHVGTCTQNGLNARSSSQGLTQYNSVIKSYCDSGDPYCCSGSDTSVHLGYVSKYDSQALSFVLGKIGG